MERVRFHPLSVSRFALNVERHLIAERMSETLRPKPSANLLIWMRSEPVSSLFTTTITKAELLYGVAPLAPGKRRQSLEAVVGLIFTDDLAGRVLPFDSAAAREYAEIAAAAGALVGQSPKPMPALPPSPGLAAPLWQHETSRICRVRPPDRGSRALPPGRKSAGDCVGPTASPSLLRRCGRSSRVRSVPRRGCAACRDS